MDNKVVWLLVAVVAIYVLMMRKKTALVVGSPYANPTYPLQSPKPAIPQPTTAQVLGAAAIKSAPQIISALGSFFDDSNDVDTSSDD